MLFSGVYILWPDPLVVSVMDDAEVGALLRMRATGHILYSPAWIWTYRNLPGLARLRWEAARKSKTLHFMCCARETDRMLRRFRFPGRHVSISSYVNEHVFQVTHEAKEYDAVYAAAMVPYKRMHLAREVARLLIQTYGSSRTPEGDYDLPSFEPAIAHASYNRGWVAAEEVVARFNRARVGLALSAVEGAMLATVEYMLCGLPVVSTPCRGGREEFFDERYVKMVEPHSDAVARGVAELIARQIDPMLVRQETLEKLERHRRRLCAYIRDIIRETGASVPSEDRVYERIFGTSRGTVACFVPERYYERKGLV
jgi:glycosyltransferase involved in cell wall biosynthesis